LTVVIGQLPEDLLVIEEMLKIQTDPLENSGLLLFWTMSKMLGCREKSFLDYHNENWAKICGATGAGSQPPGCV